MPYLSVKGESLYYLESSPEGKQLLLLCHGAGGSSRHWRFQLKGLHPEIRVIAVDLPGHGQSGGEARDSIEGYRDIIKEFTRELGAAPFFLGGHSMGGAIALSYAKEYPADLQGMLLVGTGAKLRVHPSILETYKAGKAYPELVQWSYGKTADPELVREGEEGYRQTPPRVFAADFTACDNFNLLQELESITVPAKIIAGCEDMLTPPKYSRFLQEKLKGAELNLLENAGHMVMEEQAGEVNKIIMEFIARVSGAG